MLPNLRSAVAQVQGWKSIRNFCNSSPVSKESKEASGTVLASLTRDDLLERGVFLLLGYLVGGILLKHHVKKRWKLAKKVKRVEEKVNALKEGREIE